MTLPIILASSSPYRRELLAKLGLVFTHESPDIDESRLANEDAEQMVARLAKSKAAAIAKNNDAALIIASDQVAVLDKRILGKPHNHANAVKQLSELSGRKVCFLTSLTLLNSKTQQSQCVVEPFVVKFRQLSHQEIEGYLNKEKPYDCAGSFKSEGLGITLFEKLSGDDPNILIGLPLIKLSKMLRKEGVKSY